MSKLHPEDAISEAKTFINELQKVQEQYFSKLALGLKLTKEGEDWLFDYVYNTSEDEKYDGFDHYLQDYKKNYNDMVVTDIMYNNSMETFLPTDFGEFSPMMQMSSYEADIDTNFALSFDSSEQLPSELLYNDADYLNVGHLNLDRAKIEEICAKELNAVIENHTWNSQFEPNVIVNAVCDVIEKQYNV